MTRSSLIRAHTPTHLLNDNTRFVLFDIFINQRFYFYKSPNHGACHRGDTEQTWPKGLKNIRVYSKHDHILFDCDNTEDTHNGLIFA